MSKLTPEAITASIEAAGTKKVLACPEAKQRARVNCESNFVACYASTALGAMVDAALAGVDDHKVHVSDAYVTWINGASSTPARDPSRTVLTVISENAARKAYQELRKKYGRKSRRNTERKD